LSNLLPTLRPFNKTDTRYSKQVVPAKPAAILDCGGKRSATPLFENNRLAEPPARSPKRRRRFALPAHSKDSTSQTR